MAGSVNKVILVGNLGADPEIRRLNNGNTVASFRIATGESWKDKNTGERKEHTDWHTVVCFNESLAKIAEQYLKKGMKVYVEGQMKTRKWEDQAGQARYTTEVMLQQFRGEIQMLDKAQRDPGADSPDAYGSGETRQPASARGGYGEQSGATSRRELDDEIPF